MIAKKFLIFALGIGIVAALLVAYRGPAALGALSAYPSAFLWIALAVLVTILPVKGIAGVRTLNISPLPLLTILLLYGTDMALITAWLVGLATTIASPTRVARTDFERAASNSAKWSLSILAAAYVLWGTNPGRGCISIGITTGMVLRLLVAHAAYFSVSATILSFGLWLRDGRNPFEVWRANFGWGALVSWSTPLGAYLLALFYLHGGFLLIGILVGIGLIGILTVRDHVRIKSSFVHLVDALRLARDGNMPHLRGETQRVVELALALGHKMHLPYRSLELLERAAMLHNVGYIAVDRDTILKPSLLTDAEMLEIREHPESGMRILREVKGMDNVAEIVSSHHESPDGTGYPQGLKGNKIPIEAAIIKVAEAFVAMTSQRPHRKQVYSKDQALGEIANAAGHNLDAVVAFHLFNMMGRGDLAAKVSRGFGRPSNEHIRARLCSAKSKPRLVSPATRKEKRAMVLGSLIVGAMLAALLLVSRFDIPGALGTHINGIACSTRGIVFFLGLLGLAALRPVRLPWGAYVSSASAVVLVMSLAGGPTYGVLFALASIGWAMLFDPKKALSSSAWILIGLANGSNGFNGFGYRNGTSRGPDRSKKRDKKNGGITSVIKSKALGVRLSTASVYGFVLMLAGTSAWLTFRLGKHFSHAINLSGTAAEIMPFILGVGTFYIVETLVQSALLSRDGISTRRLWQRNYLKIFPEPLTYAVCGYAILLGNNLLGLWAAIPLFLFPTLWRHLALLRRLELLKTKDSLIRAIARAVDEKDRYTGGHSASVVEIGVVIAREMGKGEPFVERIEEAAIRHDLGKVAWPNQVLRKPARFDEQEEEEYKWTHPDVSAEIAMSAGSSPEVGEMIKYHHERWDGLGYPHGLGGESIPVGARILCVADSFDAMIHDRWYKRKRTIEGAVEEIQRCSGTQFDPEVVNAFLRVLGKMDLEQLIESVEIEVGEIREEVEVGVM